jgi:hypothetical protein
MTGGEPSVWSVVSVSAPDLARTERGPAAVQHAEWVRLFLGRALAPSRLVGPEQAPSSVEYLVSGIDVSGNSRRDDAACIEAAHAVATDFEGLRDVIAYHRERIEHCSHAPAEAPLELFLTTYPMLMSVTVSDDPADWRVTDQGLCIVRWGLRGSRHRPLLQWSAQELQALQRRVIAAAGLPDVAPGDVSYGRVARAAWQVLRDDEKQERVQKVGDGPKKTWGESKVANEAPVLTNESPDAQRAMWMSWLSWKDVGVLALGIAFGACVAVAGKVGSDRAMPQVKPTPASVAQSADGELPAQGASRAGSKSSGVAGKQTAIADSGKQSNGGQQTGKPGLVTPEGGSGGTGAATGSAGSAPASSTGTTSAKAPAAAAESKGGSESPVPAAGSAKNEGSPASSMQQGESKGGGATAKEASGQQPSGNAEARKQDGASGGGGAPTGSAGSAPASSTGTTSAKAPAAAAESKGGSGSQAPAAGSTKNEGSPASSMQQEESKGGGATAKEASGQQPSGNAEARKQNGTSGGGGAANGAGGSKTSAATGATTTTPSTADPNSGPAGPVLGTAAEKPASPQTGAAAGDEPQRSEKAPTLESVLKRLADLYAKSANSSPQDNAVNELADVLKDLGQEDGNTLRTRLQDSYLTEVRALSGGTGSPTILSTIHKMSAGVPSGVRDVLMAQNEAFASVNFLIRLGDNPTKVPEGKIPTQRWYWVCLKVDDAFTKLLRGCTKGVPHSRSGDRKVQVLTINVPNLVWYQRNRGSESGECYAWSLDGPDKFDPPQKVALFLTTPQKSLKIAGFVESLVEFANRVSVDDGEDRDVGQAKFTKVLIPADVAYACAKDVLSELLKLEALSNPKPNSVEEDFEAWCRRLLEALQGQGNEQANTAFRMRDFRESLKHPPFFASDAKPNFVGALSTLGGTPKIISPATRGSGRAGHLAVLDGLALRHIGYQEEGKPPVFDAPEQLERLLGCAVFVVEPPNSKKSPSK